MGSGAHFVVRGEQKWPLPLGIQAPQLKKIERTSCAKRMRINMAKG